MGVRLSSNKMRGERQDRSGGVSFDELQEILAPRGVPSKLPDSGSLSSHIPMGRLKHPLTPSSRPSLVCSCPAAKMRSSVAKVAWPNRTGVCVACDVESAKSDMSCLETLVDLEDFVQRNRKRVGLFLVRDGSPKCGAYLNLGYGSSVSSSVLTFASAVYMRDVSEGEKESDDRKSGIC
jgi:hypothetical protein